jgi:hypothetical protein
MLFHADYLNESWLAQVNQDDTTTILRQFKCKKFENCFHEVVAVLPHLGKVNKISLNEVDESHGLVLQKAIEQKSHSIPSSSDIATFNRASTKQNIWSWLSHSFPAIHLAH